MASSRPIFVATHPRACSTAFERVFMTRRDVLKCIHEPFGDAFYFGPERLGDRYEDDETARLKSGFSDATFKAVLDQIEADASEGKRLFIKDMAHYIFPRDGRPVNIAPSFRKGKAPGEPAIDGQNANGQPENGNPTVIPLEKLGTFHFTFLIRHPRRSIPSYFRCTIPPLADITGFSDFRAEEAGYHELRRLFDYLKDVGLVGPSRAGETNGESGHLPITVLDADDLLDNPSGMIEAYCKAVGIDYTPDMLRWEDEENQQHAAKAFAKWPGFHEDVLKSTYLKPRSHAQKTLTSEQEDQEWREKFGEDAQKVIRQCVDENTPDYEYLKTFAIQL